MFALRRSPHHLLGSGILGFLLTTCLLCSLWSHASEMTLPSLSTILLCGLPGVAASALIVHRRPRFLYLVACHAGVLFAALRLAVALPSPAPLIASPSTLSAQLTVVDLPSPSPHGWRLRLHDPRTSHTYLAMLPEDRLDDPHAPPLPGTILHADLSIAPTPARHTPGMVHPRTKLALARAHAYARVESFSLVKQPARASSTLHVQMRHALIKHIRLILPEEDAALVLAMTLGIKDFLPDHLREPFGVTGTAHLLAISGLHLGTLAALLIALITWLGAPLCRQTTMKRGLRALTYPGVALSLCTYVWMIGAPTSARRALAMLLCMIGAHLLRRRLPPLTILVWSAALLCMLDPLHVLEPAFWLSVSATGAILLVLHRPPLRHGTVHTGWRYTCGRAMKASLAAWLGTAPVVLAISHELPLIGIPLNMVLVPLVGFVIFPLMVCGVMLCAISPALARYPLHWSTFLLESSAAACDQVAMWHGATWRPGHTPLWLILIAAMLVFIAIRALSLQRIAHALFAIMLAAASIALHDTWRTHQQHGSLRVDFIDVGQGDATLVTFPDGATMLVDAGGKHIGRDPGASRVVPWLRYRGIAQLDTMVLTHADVDHMRGLFAVTRRAPPREFIANADATSHEFLKLCAALTARAIPITPTHARQRFEHAGVQVIFHALDEATLGRNDRSVVIELHYQGASILLPGDIEHPAERALTQKLSSPMTLLKMPHHGSHSSSTAAMLDHLRPRIAIASCGLHNRFGHPRPDVLARYAERGVDIWRTDHYGTLTATILPDGRLTIAHPTQLP